MAVIPDMRGMGEIWGAKGDRGRGGENLLTEASSPNDGEQQPRGSEGMQPMCRGGNLSTSHVNNVVLGTLICRP